MNETYTVAFFPRVFPVHFPPDGGRGSPARPTNREICPCPAVLKAGQGEEVGREKRAREVAEQREGTAVDLISNDSLLADP